MITNKDLFYYYDKESNDVIKMEMRKLIDYLNDSVQGRGIVSIDKTSTTDLVDTYTITYTDETTSTFEVSNGKSGKDGKSIVSIEKIKTEGLVDTYRINFSDGNYFDYTLKNGTSASSDIKGHVVELNTTKALISVCKMSLNVDFMVDLYLITFNGLERMDNSNFEIIRTHNGILKVRPLKQDYFGKMVAYVLTSEKTTKFPKVYGEFEKLPAIQYCKVGTNIFNFKANCFFKALNENSSVNVRACYLFAVEDGKEKIIHEFGSFEEVEQLNLEQQVVLEDKDYLDFGVRLYSNDIFNIPECCSRIMNSIPLQEGELLMDKYTEGQVFETDDKGEISIDLYPRIKDVRGNFITPMNGKVKYYIDGSIIATVDWNLAEQTLDLQPIVLKFEQQNVDFKVEIMADNGTHLKEHIRTFHYTIKNKDIRNPYITPRENSVIYFDAGNATFERNNFYYHRPDLLTNVRFHIETFLHEKQETIESLDATSIELQENYIKVVFPTVKLAEAYKFILSYAYENTELPENKEITGYVEGIVAQPCRPRAVVQKRVASPPPTWRDETNEGELIDTSEIFDIENPQNIYDMTMYCSLVAYRMRPASRVRVVWQQQYPRWGHFFLPKDMPKDCEPWGYTIGIEYTVEYIERYINVGKEWFKKRRVSYYVVR